MTFESLKQYPAIGWDFDNTLHGHPASPEMHEFIMQNPQIKHFIVTFRSHGWEGRVFDELKKYKPHLGPEHFEAVLNIADETYEAYMMASRIKTETANEDIVRFLEWKGMICAKNEIPILIDDMTDLVVLGCTKHQVAHVHPDALMLDLIRQR